MSGDKFVSTNKNIKEKKLVNDDNNFFLQADGRIVHVSQPEPIRHLNDYDYNILQDEAYKEVSDEVLKLEYKISRAEKEIQDLEKHIQLSKEINDENTVRSLSEKKMQWEADLKDLTQEYKNVSISAKISGGFTSKIKDKIDSTKKALGVIGDTILSKLPGKLSSIFEIKNSLIKLENINKSVDELIAVQYPYGEAGDKYEQLSKYIARANSIQAEISRFMK